MKKVILIGVPRHNNLGDNAIAMAEEKFIKENLTDYKYYEVEEENVDEQLKEIKQNINNEDIILYHGGGNIGDEYLYVEEERRNLIKAFPNNLIIILPQTIYFKDKKELEKSKEIYGKHPNLVLCAREDTSYNVMKKEFKHNKVIFVPDIVTYLNETKKGEDRSGLLCIFRNDIEIKMTTEEKQIIKMLSKKYFGKIEYDDTAVGNPIPTSELRKEKLEKMFDKYRRAELVITDRLHGMIFAAITSTPCIALSNYNHKVKDTAKYLNYLGYVRYVEDVKELEKNIKELLNTKFLPYDNKELKEKQKEIIKIVHKNG